MIKKLVEWIRQRVYMMDFVIWLVPVDGLGDVGSAEKNTHLDFTPSFEEQQDTIVQVLLRKVNCSVAKHVYREWYN